MKTSQQGFIPILIAIIAVLIIGGGAVYYKATTKQKVTTETTADVQTSRPAPPAQAPTQTPPSPPAPSVAAQGTVVAGSAKAAYLAMKPDLDSATSFDEYLTIGMKYASRAKIAQLNAGKAQIDAMPQATKNSLFAAVKALGPSVSHMKNISESINGDTATLNITTDITSTVTGRNTTGTVTMKKENGVWKLEVESWKG